MIISRLIQLRCGIIKSFDLDSTIEEVKEMFNAGDEDDEDENVEEIFDFSEIDQLLFAEKNR